MCRSDVGIAFDSKELFREQAHKRAMDRLNEAVAQTIQLEDEDKAVSNRVAAKIVALLSSEGEEGGEGEGVAFGRTGARPGDRGKASSES